MYLEKINAQTWLQPGQVVPGQIQNDQALQFAKQLRLQTRQLVPIQIQVFQGCQAVEKLRLQATPSVQRRGQVQRLQLAHVPERTRRQRPQRVVRDLDEDESPAGPVLIYRVKDYYRHYRVNNKNYTVNN